jgi:AcrR family transcriptional regulator
VSNLPAGYRKKRGEGYTRRDEILSAAQELFLREGYEATTIRRIAEVVGVSAPALYLYFKDKEAILLALSDQTFARLMARMAEIENQGAPPIERLRQCAEAYIRFALDNPREYWLTFMSSGGQSKSEQGAVAFSRLTGMFREIEQTGTPLHYPPETAAELAWMSLHGLAAAIVNDPDFPVARRDPLIAGMVGLVVRGVVRAA